MAQIEIMNQCLDLFLRQQTGRWTAHIDDCEYDVQWQWLSKTQLLLQLNGEETALTIAEHDGIYFVHGYGRSWQLRHIDPLSKGGATGADHANAAVAPMPGTVISINVQTGETVSKGQLLLTIESMKMLTDINASRAGEIDEVLVAVGDTFQKGARLISLKE